MKPLIFQLVLFVPVFATRPPGGVERQRLARTGTSQGTSSSQRNSPSLLKGISSADTPQYGASPSPYVSHSPKATIAPETNQRPKRSRPKAMPQDPQQSTSRISSADNSKLEIERAKRKQRVKAQQDIRAANPQALAKFKEAKRVVNQRYMAKVKADPERLEKHKELQRRVKDRLRNEAGKTSRASRASKASKSDTTVSSYQSEIVHSENEEQKLPSWGTKALRTTLIRESPENFEGELLAWGRTVSRKKGTRRKKGKNVAKELDLPPYNQQYGTLEQVERPLQIRQKQGLDGLPNASLTLPSESLTTLTDPSIMQAQDQETVVSRERQKPRKQVHPKQS